MTSLIMYFIVFNPFNITIFLRQSLRPITNSHRHTSSFSEAHWKLNVSNSYTEKGGSKPELHQPCVILWEILIFRNAFPLYSFFPINLWEIKLNKTNYSSVVTGDMARTHGLIWAQLGLYRTLATRGNY